MWGTTSGRLPEVVAPWCGFGVAKLLVDVIIDGQGGFRTNGDEFSVVSQNLEIDHMVYIYRK